MGTDKDEMWRIAHYNINNNNSNSVAEPEPLLFYQAAPQLYSRGWVDPVPDPLLLRNVLAPEIEPGPVDM
jgi:hypothetical protein